MMNSDYSDLQNAYQSVYYDDTLNHSLGHKQMEEIYNQYYQTTFTTNTTSSSPIFNTVTTNYVPFQNEYTSIYDPIFSWHYEPNITGLREYMFANNLYKELADILYDMYLVSDDDQEFEDSLYRNTLDLLYESTRAEDTLNDLLNEDLFDYQGINKVIAEIIDSYRLNFKTEEF